MDIWRVRVGGGVFWHVQVRHYRMSFLYYMSNKSTPTHILCLHAHVSQYLYVALTRQACASPSKSHKHYVSSPGCTLLPRTRTQRAQRLIIPPHALPIHLPEVCYALAVQWSCWSINPLPNITAGLSAASGCSSSPPYHASLSMSLSIFPALTHSPAFYLTYSKLSGAHTSGLKKVHKRCIQTVHLEAGALDVTWFREKQEQALGLSSAVGYTLQIFTGSRSPHSTSQLLTLFCPFSTPVCLTGSICTCRRDLGFVFGMCWKYSME